MSRKSGGKGGRRRGREHPREENQDLVGETLRALRKSADYEYNRARKGKKKPLGVTQDEMIYNQEHREREIEAGIHDEKLLDN